MAGVKGCALPDWLEGMGLRWGGLKVSSGGAGPKWAQGGLKLGWAQSGLVPKNPPPRKFRGGGVELASYLPRVAGPS